LQYDVTNERRKGRREEIVGTDVR